MAAGLSSCKWEQAYEQGPQVREGNSCKLASAPYHENLVSHTALQIFLQGLLLLPASITKIALEHLSTVSWTVYESERVCHNALYHSGRHPAMRCSACEAFFQGKYGCLTSNIWHHELLTLTA